MTFQFGWRRVLLMLFMKHYFDCFRNNMFGTYKQMTPQDRCGIATLLWLCSYEVHTTRIQSLCFVLFNSIFWFCRWPDLANSTYSWNIGTFCSKSATPSPRIKEGIWNHFKCHAPQTVEPVSKPPISKYKHVSEEWWWYLNSNRYIPTYFLLSQLFIHYKIRCGFPACRVYHAKQYSDWVTFIEILGQLSHSLLLVP